MPDSTSLDDGVLADVSSSSAGTMISCKSHSPLVPTTEEQSPDKISFFFPLLCDSTLTCTFTCRVKTMVCHS